MRIVLLLVAVIVVGAVVGVGLKQASDDSGASDTPEAIAPDAKEVASKLSGAPPALAALHAQADELLPGALPALRARLDDVRGHPAVVNIWASWCGPCNQEAPVLQRVALDRGRDVAFIGVDLKDSRSGAQRFLRRFPSTYPSYEDPDGRIYNHYKLAGAPTTIFFDAQGRQTYLHSGPYLTTADLERDIDKYGLGRNVAQAR